MNEGSLFIAVDGTGFNDLEFRNYYCFVLAQLQELESRWLGPSFETTMLEVVARMKREKLDGADSLFVCGRSWDGKAWPEGYLQHDIQNARNYHRAIKRLLAQNKRLEFLIAAFERRLHCINSVDGREYRDVIMKRHANPEMVCYRNVIMESVFDRSGQVGIVI